MKNIILLVLFFSTFLSINAQNYKYGKVSQEEVEATSFSKDSSANAVILYREQHISYNFSKDNGFELIEEIHERVKIYNKEGFDWATREIDYYVSNDGRESISNLKGETYNIEGGALVSVKLDKDGIFEEEVSKYRERIKFTMPSIKAGSVVEFKYIRKSPFITSINDIPLQYTIPIQKLDFQITIPEYYTFNTYFNPRCVEKYDLDNHSGRGSFTMHSIDRTYKGNLVNQTNKVQKLEFKTQIYKIEKENVPALKSEPYIDYLSNYAGFLKMELVYIQYPNSSIESYTENWINVASKIQSHAEFGGQLDKTNYFENDVDALLAGKTGPMEKISAILEFVKSKVKWNNYVGYYTDKGVKSAYKEGVGNTADINLMLTAMLSYAGLDANPVLLSTKSNGVPLFPTRNGFNYVIASVKYDNKIILLDATEKYTTPNLLPERAQNWIGRLVRKDGSSESVDLTSTSVSNLTKVLKVKFEDELDITGNYTQIATGYFAKEFRDSHEDMNDDALLNEFENGKGNIEVLNIDLQNKDGKDDKVVESYNFKLKNGVDRINDNIYIKPMFFMAQKSNPFKSENRSLPIFFKYPSSEAKTVFIQLPENYEVTSLPESKVIELNQGQGMYKFIVLQSGNYIKITSELQMNNIVYSPNDYETLKKFYNEMVVLNSETIVLNKI